jgi:hypothetical protein
MRSAIAVEPTRSVISIDTVCVEVELIGPSSADQRAGATTSRWTACAEWLCSVGIDVRSADARFFWVRDLMVRELMVDWSFPVERFGRLGLCWGRRASHSRAGSSERRRQPRDVYRLRSGHRHLADAP